MRSMITIGVFLSLVLTLSLIVPEPASGSARAKVSSTIQQDESTSKLQELEKRIEKLESEKATMELQVKTQSALLTDIYSWMRSLPAASESLAAGLEEARKDGFAKAGPNPRSKNKVLDSLKNFAAALNSGNPAKPKVQPKK